MAGKCTRGGSGTNADEAAELVGQIEAQLGLLDCPAVELPYRDLAFGRTNMS
ncbi:hypothetical protein [Streptomyces silvisoli]|uniref:Acyl carrier protein n=1 Tax=Streptomyces silvisoli TaxID=3034235 RepID=A0ABT5ZX51_9ACTN|nr:hypothetical protein [Streptomyces silvisoli]MDF3294410.1 hypothetical protein [Streptomyces silvisoli]